MTLRGTVRRPNQVVLVPELSLAHGSLAHSLRTRIEGTTDLSFAEGAVAPRPTASGSCVRLDVRGLMLRGELPEWVEECGLATSTTRLIHELDEISANALAGEILMVWDTPGGEGSGCDELAAAIRRVNTIKPINSLVEGVCCSAGIYAASGSETITATPSSLVGSIGAFSVVEDTTRLYAAMGVDVTIVRSAVAKGQAEGAPPTPEQLKNKAELIQFLHEQFVSALSEGRKLPRDQVARIATGEIWPAQKAAELKLIDYVGTKAASGRRAQQIQTPAPRVEAPKAPKIKVSKPKLAAATQQKGQKMTYAQLIALLMADPTLLAADGSGTDTVGSYFSGVLADCPLLQDERMAVGFPADAPPAADPAAKAMAALPAELRGQMAAAQARTQAQLAASEKRIKELEESQARERYTAEASAFRIPGLSTADIIEDLRAADSRGVEAGKRERAKMKAAHDGAAGHPALNVAGANSQGAQPSVDTPEGARAELNRLAIAAGGEYHAAYIAACSANPSLYAMAIR